MRKIDFIIKNGKVPKSDFTGLSTFASPSATGSTLAIKDFNRAVKYLKSKKYQKRIQEEREFKYRGQQIVSLALDQKIITMKEYWYLMMTININGGLIVSPKMYKRLSKVKLKIK